MLNRTELGSQIVQRILTVPNTYIFGGYLRDTLAGDSFRDIDVRGDIKSIVMALSEICSVRRHMASALGRSSYARYTLLCSGLDRDVVLSVDVGEIRETTEHLPDANVNRLMWSQGGLAAFSRTAKTNINVPETTLNILDDIRNKRFCRENGCPDCRVQKLIDMGWKEY